MAVDVHGLDDRALMHVEEGEIFNHVQQPLGRIDGQDVLNKTGEVVLTTRNHQVLKPRSGELMAEVHGNMVGSEVGTNLAKVYGGTRQEKAKAAAGFLAFFTNL